MYIQILLFGIVSDLIKTEDNTIHLNLEKRTSLAELKLVLSNKYQLKDIKNFMIAVNENYEHDDYVIKEQDVLAIIPPVSGG